MEDSGWEAGVTLFISGRLDSAITAFKDAGDTAKINFNIAITHSKNGNFRAAIDHFDRAISQDKYMAVAYFARGTCHFMMYGYEPATQDFSKSLELFHTHDRIDYRPLGLPFTLLRADVYYNRALCYMAMNVFENAQADMVLARRAYVDRNRRKHATDMLGRIQNVMKETGVESQLKDTPTLQADVSPVTAQERSTKELVQSLKNMADSTSDSVLDLYIQAKVAHAVDPQLAAVLPPYPTVTELDPDQNIALLVDAALSVQPRSDAPVSTVSGSNLALEDTYGAELQRPLPPLGEATEMEYHAADEMGEQVVNTLRSRPLPGVVIERVEVKKPPIAHRPIGRQRSSPVRHPRGLHHVTDNTMHEHDDFTVENNVIAEEQVMEELDRLINE